MDYYEGEILNKRIEEKPLPLDEATDIAEQIAQGLAKAHEKEIIHRDIKSSNVMLTKDGVVKILDFGLAKLSTQTQITRESTTLGTVSYMSPEQAKGDTIDNRTDIWSLGVIIYEMLTGQLPFKGEYDSAVIYSILNDPSQALKSLRTGVPLELERIINKCLRKAPADRYQHAEDLIVDLRELKKESKSLSIARTASNKNKVKFIVWPAVILSIVVLSAVAYYLIRGVETDKSDLPLWDNSIAVLPFSDLSPNRDQEHFCDGMTEQILTNLSKLNRLKVIGRTSVMKFKQTTKTLPEIGNELNVAYILEGSVRIYGSNSRVTVQLINAQDGTHLWAEDYDRELENLFAIQDDISEKICSVLLQKLSVNEKEGIRSKRPKSIEAWEYYTRGKFFHYQKYLGTTYSRDDFNTAEAMFKKAIEIDPDYAASYASLADLYNSIYNSEKLSDQENERYLELQEKHIKAAYKLDPNSAEVLLVKGYVHRARDEVEDAYTSFKKSVLLEPNNCKSNFSFGRFYEVRGLHNLAIIYLTKAIELNPLYPRSYYRRAQIYMKMGEMNNAESDLLKALDIDPEHRASLGFYTLLLILEKRYGEADKIIATMEKYHPESETNEIHKRLIRLLRGDNIKLMPSNFTDYYSFIFHLLSERKEETLAYLNKNLDWCTLNEISWYISFKNLSAYNSLRIDPRFQEIVEKHKVLYDKNIRKYGDINI